VFALRQSGRYRVGAVGHVQWQRGWYSVVIEEVAQNAPKVRISYLPPYNAYTTDDDWKHFWEVHFDEEAAKGAEATRTASAQRVAMYRQVKLEKEEQAAEEAQCREFARQWIVSGMLSNPIRGALARGYHSGVPERPPTPRQDKNKPWMNIYARPLSAEQRPEAGLAAATRVARPWTPLPKAPPPPEPEPEEEPWLDEERAALMANVSVHGAKNWVQRAYELGTYRTPEEVERAWTKFDEEERELAQLRAKLEAEAEARQLALDAEEAQRRVEEAQALQLYDEAALYTEQGDFKHAYEALVPASALAPNHTGIAAALDRATEKYEEWLAKTEELRRKQQEAKERREKALKLSATKASHPMQWAVFRQIDTSGDGLLQADEVRAYMTELGQPEMATQLLDALDRDGDGDIDFPEFCAGWERWLANNSVGTNDHLAGS
jgi:tetratricopeptide (TPR) repeat protein